MFISNAAAHQIMAIPASERTDAQATLLATWFDIEPEYDRAEDFDY